VDPLTPADTEVLVVIDVRRMLDAPLVKKKELEDANAGIKNDQVGKVLTAAGIDPRKDIDTVTFSLSGTSTAKALAVVRGRYDLKKVHAAAEDYAKKNEDKLKVTKEGSTTVYETKIKDTPVFKDAPVFAAFADRSTLLVALNKDSLLEAVKNTDKRPAKLNADLQKALGKLSGKESVWLAVAITDEMRKGMARNPQVRELASKLESVTGGVTLTDSALIQLLIHTTDEKAAVKVKMLVNQGKQVLQLLAQSNEDAGPVLGEILDELKISSSKTTVTISLKITQETLDKLDKAAKERDKDKDKDK